MIRTILPAVLALEALLAAVGAWAPGFQAPLPSGSPLSAQVVEPRVGTVEAGLLLRQLDGEKRVLMIAAHPDDEDTAVLTTLARGLGVRAAYLSLSRGEGGQNLIGPELGEGLGLIRTGELLSARALDGAEQFFTRAFDFGYSKSAEETFGHWPEEELLRDVVWVVRSFRPHVILSVFSGTPRDGHGQHQAAGVAAHRAFEVAADPEWFPDQLEHGVEAWAPAKLYRLVRWNPEAATLTLETGRLDPLLGRSHLQVAMESRSRHRSQAFGTARPPGPRETGAELARARVEAPPGGEDGFFTAVDTSLAGIARTAMGPAPGGDRLLATLEAYREALRDASEDLHASDPDRASPHLIRALEHLLDAFPLAREAPAGPGRTELTRVLERRQRGVAEALLATASVVADVRVARDQVVPGEEAEVEVLVWNGGHRRVEVEELHLQLPDGWTITDGTLPRVTDEMGSGASPTLVPAGDLRRWTVQVRAPGDAAPSRPYFLEEARDGALYRWPDEPEIWARPLDPPLLAARFSLRVEGSPPLVVDRPGSHVSVDRSLGEFRVPVFVVPALSVEVDPDRIAWPRDAGVGKEVTVRVRNLSGASAEGELRLQAPEGWEVRPERHALNAPAGGGEASVTFRVRPGPEAGEGEAIFRAVARAGEREYTEGFTLVDYPHLDPAPLYRPAELRVSHFPVRLREGLRVGYVMGSGDEGIRALRDLGTAVEALDAEALRAGDLSRYDAIVLGIRAYETRPDLVGANERLLAFARGGGTVVVQYHRYEYPAGGFAPFPLSIARPHDRVTDPDAAVTFLEPDHPVLSRPNRLTDADFQGWVQERGLYFLSEWDAGYTPLLEMADPGETPSRGSLMVARVGEGAYVYTGLALFRQLPRGVPGAYRLLANLVSLQGKDL